MNFMCELARMIATLDAGLAIFNSIIIRIMGLQDWLDSSKQKALDFVHHAHTALGKEATTGEACPSSALSANYWVHLSHNELC